jgi:hypothetical protein
MTEIIENGLAVKGASGLVLGVQEGPNRNPGGVRVRLVRSGSSIPERRTGQQVVWDWIRRIQCDPNLNPGVQVLLVRG